MSEDLTKKDSDTDSERLKLILTLVQKLQGYGEILTQIRDSLRSLTSRVDAVETRLDVVESRLDSIEGELQSLKKTMQRSVQSLGRGQTILNDAILKIHIGFLHMDERLRGLEPQHKPTNSQT